MFDAFMVATWPFGTHCIPNGGYWASEGNWVVGVFGWCMVPGKAKGGVGRGSRSKRDTQGVPFFLNFIGSKQSHSGIIINHAVHGQQLE